MLNGNAANGREQSIEHLLQDLALDARVVAVELNRLVVKRGRTRTPWCARTTKSKSFRFGGG